MGACLERVAHYHGCDSHEAKHGERHGQDTLSASFNDRTDQGAAAPSPSGFTDESTAITVSEAITGRSDSARPRLEIRVPDAQQQVNRDRRPAERVEEAGKLTEQGDD